VTPQERWADTQLIPPVPPAIPDPFPPMPPLRRPPAGRRADHRDRSGTLVGTMVKVTAVTVLLVLAFIAGQITVRTGALPPPPAPHAASEVVTHAAMARLWPVTTPADQGGVCDPWSRGAWREYITDRWAGHLASPAGGRIDVDRATVARFLDRACARWAETNREG
jgi:hypothetical protein